LKEGGVRIARSVPTLDPVEVGDHVCWLVDTDEDFTGGAGAFVADGALFGDKVLVVGPADRRWSRRGAAPGLVVVDPGVEPADGGPWDADVMLGVVRREADAASRQGFRALRVLAQMDRLWPAGARPGQVAGHELGLDALVARGGAIVVCAYRRDRFSPAALEQAAGVHPQYLGTRGVMAPSFRIFSAGPDSWSVSGVVDAEGAAAFRIAVDELVSRSTTVRLQCGDLELMDVAGMGALAAAARGLPGGRVVLHDANETLRRCWELLGYDTPEIPVEMAP
jgi:anti-anti-sigma regulatory factor